MAKKRTSVDLYVNAVKRADREEEIRRHGKLIYLQILYYYLMPPIHHLQKPHIVLHSFSLLYIMKDFVYKMPSP